MNGQTNWAVSVGRVCVLLYVLCFDTAHKLHHNGDKRQRLTDVNLCVKVKMEKTTSICAH